MCAAATPAITPSVPRGQVPGPSRSGPSGTRHSSRRHSSRPDHSHVSVQGCISEQPRVLVGLRMHSHNLRTLHVDVGEQLQQRLFPQPVGNGRIAPHRRESKPEPLGKTRRGASIPRGPTSFLRAGSVSVHSLVASTSIGPETPRPLAQRPQVMAGKSVTTPSGMGWRSPAGCGHVRTGCSSKSGLGGRGESRGLAAIWTSRTLDLN